jgi:hypothetical protein
MNEHWLLTTSDREHGGKLVLGIFNTEDEAWAHYRKTHQDENDRYYRIPSVACWVNDKELYGHDPEEIS